MPDLNVLPEHIRDSVLPDTIEPFAEAAWFAWRRSETMIDIRNGVWWTEDGSRVLSLAVGTALHYHGGVDWETYRFVGAAEGACEDVCCHDTEDAAKACALMFLLFGRYCSDAAAA